MEIQRISNRILHALTMHDKHQSKRPGYNRYALAHYCKGLNDWKADPDTKANPLGTLPRYFTTHTNFRTMAVEFSIGRLDSAVKKLKAELAAAAPTVAAPKLERCPGCGCQEELIADSLCKDCMRDQEKRANRLDEPKSWQQQLANMENPEL